MGFTPDNNRSVLLPSGDAPNEMRFSGQVKAVDAVERAGAVKNEQELNNSSGRLRTELGGRSFPSTVRPC